MSISEFHKTTAKELEAVKDRIRLLVDHWGEDGKYKEKIFINILKKFLPQKYGVASGFVVKRKPFTFEEHQENKPFEHISSAQIDVIIFNSDSPLLFREGDFAIVTPEAVEAIIEIKTNLENANAKSVIEKMNDQGDFVLTGKSNKQKVLFNGIFSYEGFDNIDGAKIEKYYKQGSEIAVKDKKHSHFQFSRVNHIAFNKSWLLKYWEDQVASGSESLYVYEIENLAFSFFISSLLQHLSSEAVNHENSIWFPKESITTKNKFKFPE